MTGNSNDSKKLISKNIILILTFWVRVNLVHIIFQLTVNIILTINSLIENAYMTNGLHNWHTKLLCLMFGVTNISFFCYLRVSNKFSTYFIYCIFTKKSK